MAQDSEQPTFRYPCLPKRPDEAVKTDTEENVASSKGSKPLWLPIRLFKLDPADSLSDALVGEMVSWNHEEQYHALSYHWGSGNAKARKVRIRDGIGEIKRGQSSQEHMITVNLAEALSFLRYSDRPRTFWIDDISIDQRNRQEKSEQIAIMDKIFQHAEEVCVWLGHVKDDASIAFTLVEEMLTFGKFESLLKEEKGEENTKKWIALSNLMRREYFSRRWVVQEVAYAKTARVYCHNLSMTWEDLTDAVTLFVRRAKDISELFKTSTTYRKYEYLGKVEALGAYQLVRLVSKVFRKSIEDDGSLRIDRLMPLETVLTQLSSFRTGRSHDMIYSVLTLARETYASTVKEDRELIDRIKKDKLEALIEKTKERLRNIQEPENAESDQSENLRRLSNRSMRSKNWPFDIAAVSLTGASRRRAGSVSPTSTLLENGEAEDSETLGPAVILPEDRDKAREIVMRQLMFLESLMKSRNNKTFKVDYDQPFFGVCRDLVQFLIDRSGSCDMLVRPWAPRPNDLDSPEHLPSWICTMQQSEYGEFADGTYGRINSVSLAAAADFDRNVYRASAGTKIAALKSRGFTYRFGNKTSHDEKSLYLSGFVFDTIGDVSVCAVNGIIPVEWIAFGNWEKPNENPPPENFWRTLVADRDSAGDNPPPFWRRACQFCFSKRPKGGNLDTKDLISHPDLHQTPSDVIEFLQRVQDVAWKRKMIRTSKGKLLGLTPEMAQKGDLVCILRGCSVPMILRVETCKPLGPSLIKKAKVDGRTSAWPEGLLPDHLIKEADAKDSSHPCAASDSHLFRISAKLIGEAYIENMMYGEALRLRAKQDLGEWEFELK